MVRLRCGKLLAGAAVLLDGGLFPAGKAFCSAQSSDTSIGGLFSAESPVDILNRKTFISSVLEAQRPALVLFHSGSECQQCEDAAKVIEKASKKLASWGVSVGAVDISAEPKLSKELAFPKSMPMLMKMYHSKSTANPYGGLPVRAEAFIGNFQDARTLQKNVLSAIPNLVTSVNLAEGSSTLKEAFASGEEAFAAVLLTEASKASPVLRVLASETQGKVAAVQARVPKAGNGDGLDDEEEEGSAADVTWPSLLEGVIDVPESTPSAPCLLLVDKNTGKATVFDGDVEDSKAMAGFIRESASNAFSGSDSEGPNTSGDGDADSGDSKKKISGGVIMLDPESLALQEEKGVEALVVAFVDGGDTSAIPGWDKATKGLEGQIRSAIFDCSAHPSECGGSSGKKKAPHLRVYSHLKGSDGDGRSLPTILPASQIQEAVSEAEASLPDMLTVIPAGTGSHRTQEALQAVIGTSVLAEGNPMVLLVLSKREEPNLVVKTIAAQFQSAKIRTVFMSQPDAETMAAVNVEKLPAMFLMFKAREDMEIQQPSQPQERGEAMATAHYSPAMWGPVGHKRVSEFILSHLSNVDVDAFYALVQEMAEIAEVNGETLSPQLQLIYKEYIQSEEGVPSARGDSQKSSPFEGIPEATPETWAAMTGEGTASANSAPVGVFMLDRYSDSFGSAFKAAEAAAGQASTRLGGRGGGFAWVDAPCQEGFAKALGVSDASEVPGLVVYSPKHQKSARFVGAWEADSLALFLGKALGGRTPLFAVDGDAPRLDTVDCSQRESPASTAGGQGDGGEGVEDDDMGDFMAEILAEEAQAKRELEEEVAKGLEELKLAEEKDATPKKKTKKVIKKKKKKAGSGGSEL